MRLTRSLSAAVAAATLSVLPAAAADDDLAAARAMVLAAYPGECDADLAERFEGLEDVAFDVSWAETDYDGSEVTKTGRLFQINCWVGAYNVGAAYVFAPEDGFSEKGQIVAFAAPSFSVDYEDGDDTYTKLVRDPEVDGFDASAILTNPDFDPETNTISTFGKWRGLGDAYSAGFWTLEKGRFVLKHYVIDPIYEANLENPPDELIDTAFVLYDAER